MTTTNPCALTTRIDMIAKTLTRVLPVVLALCCASFAQTINYPLPQTHSSVNYNRGYGIGTFVVPWEGQGSIPVTINGVSYNFTFSLTVNGNAIEPAQSKVQFCQTQNVGVCSTGSPSGTFTPDPAGQYWGVFQAVSFDAEGPAGSFKSSGSYFDFGIVNRISYSILKADSILALE